MGLEDPNKIFMMKQWYGELSYDKVQCVFSKMHTQVSGLFAQNLSLRMQRADTASFSRDDF